MIRYTEIPIFTHNTMFTFSTWYDVELIQYAIQEGASLK